MDGLRLAAAAYGHKLRRIVTEARSDSVEAERNRAAFYERVWREAADELGAVAEPLGSGVFEMARGNVRVRVCANESPLDNGVTLRIAGDKPLVHRMLMRAGIPVPRHAACTAATLGDAFRFAAELGGPVVVKPAFGTGGGVGVTANVRGRPSVLRALAWARSYCASMLVEEQMEGEIYRLLYFDGVLIDCVVRRAPVVTGDGRANIAELVRRENQARAAQGATLAQGLLWMDQDLHRELARQGMSPRSVPPEGMRVRVKRVVNDNRGEDNETAELCPAIVEAGQRAVQAVGARLAGIDVITADPTRPLEETGGAVIEINTTPGFYYHYHKKDGRVPVARLVLEKAFDDAGR
jgi:cyanophycin synthetase